MSVGFEETVRYVCRKCGWEWSRKVNVSLSPETIDCIKNGLLVHLERPISGPEGPCCNRSKR